jgi:hypothetical protein
MLTGSRIYPRSVTRYPRRYDACVSQIVHTSLLCFYSIEPSDSFCLNPYGLSKL